MLFQGILWRRFVPEARKLQACRDARAMMVTTYILEENSLKQHGRDMHLGDASTSPSVAALPQSRSALPRVERFPLKRHSVYRHVAVYRVVLPWCERTSNSGHQPVSTQANDRWLVIAGRFSTMYNFHRFESIKQNRPHRACSSSSEAGSPSPELVVHSWPRCSD